MMFIDPYRLPFCMNCDGLSVTATATMVAYHLMMLVMLVIMVTMKGGGVL